MSRKHLIQVFFFNILGKTKNTETEPKTIKNSNASNSSNNRNNGSDKWF